MITPDWVRMMARYNAWQNSGLQAGVQALDEAEAERDRGAFFGSIRRTASHVLWADEVWLSRFVGAPRDAGDIAHSADWAPDIADWAARRPGVDAELIAWADGLGDCGGDVTWFSGAVGRDLTRPRALLYTHLFNHQTHHRGQIHAMLTAAGGRQQVTDLPFMAEFA